MSMGVDHGVGLGRPACRIGGIPNYRVGEWPILLLGLYGYSPQEFFT